MLEEWVHRWAGFSAIVGIPDWKTVTDFWPVFAVAILAAYVLGSIPFGLVLTRLAGGPDIRHIGSGNIGATNVLRSGSKWLAALTLVLDMGKGTAAVLLVRDLGGGPDAAFFAAPAVVIGHMFPVWLRFRGGKGVATSLGVLLAIAWPIGVAVIGIWLAMAAVFRISSLSALVAGALAPFAAWIFSGAQATTLAVVLALFVWAKHAGNIRRLLHGQEPRIQLK